MENEKCFCHIEYDGEQYVVKDKEARQKLTELKDYIDTEIENAVTGDIDLSSYATIKYVDDAIANIEISGDGDVTNVGKTITVLDYDYIKDTAECRTFFENLINENKDKQIFLFVGKTPTSTGYKYNPLSVGTFTTPNKTFVFEPVYNVATLKDGTVKGVGVRCRGSLNDDNTRFIVSEVTLQVIAPSILIDTKNTTSFVPTGDYQPATKKYVDSMLSAGFTAQIVSELPTENISSSILYMVPSSTPDDSSIYNEFLYIDGHGWEKIGSTSVDLTNYVTNELLNQCLDDVNEDITKINGDIATLNEHDVIRTQEINEFYNRINSECVHDIHGFYFLSLPFTEDIYYVDYRDGQSENPERLLCSQIVTLCKTMWNTNASILLHSSALLGGNALCKLETDLIGSATPNIITFRGIKDVNENGVTKIELEFTGNWNTETDEDGNTIYNFSCYTARVEQTTETTNKLVEHNFGSVTASHFKSADFGYPNGYNLSNTMIIGKYAYGTDSNGIIYDLTASTQFTLGADNISLGVTNSKEVELQNVKCIAQITKIN